MDPERWDTARLAGQRLIVGFEGLRFDDALADLLARCKPAGVILFRRNVSSPEQLRALTAALQGFAAAIGLPPLIVSVDQEGGRVARLGPPFTQFPNTPPVATLEEAERFAAVTAAELAAAGINTNLAPVLDIAPPGFGSVMEGRALGGDPQTVTRLGIAIMSGLQSRGILSVAKHFPGLGRTRLDSHEDLPVLDEEPAALEAFDLLPFRAAVSAGAAGILLAHLLCPRLDPERPASLSRAVAVDVLRCRLGYPGLSFTDDLNMGAVAKTLPFEEAVRSAFHAGVDLLLVCRDLERAARAHDVLVKELEETGSAGRDEALRSIARILQAKHRFARG